MMSEAELSRLVGHRFPGGNYTIEHWENYLLTDCTGREPMSEDLAHPVILFHMPILGAGTSIAELFRLGQVEGAGSVGLDGYNWEYFKPLREGVEYRCEGSITSAERRNTDSGRVYDAVSFSIDLFEPAGTAAARITNYWRFRR
ncbi:MAG: hypothetical protein ACR2PK_16255 [Acidimicrobiales bacterium]